VVAMAEQKRTDLHISPADKFVRADILSRIFAHLAVISVQQKRALLIECEGELYADDEIDILQRLKI
jgi:hypothetical protein